MLNLFLRHTYDDFEALLIVQLQQLLLNFGTEYFYLGVQLTVFDYLRDIFFHCRLGGSLKAICFPLVLEESCKVAYGLFVHQILSCFILFLLVEGFVPAVVLEPKGMESPRDATHHKVTGEKVEIGFSPQVALVEAG